MKQRNDFLLPNELGWKCNDELSELLSQYAFDWSTVLTEYARKDQKSGELLAMVITAEAMDNIYAVIKEYQK